VTIDRLDIRGVGTRSICAAERYLVNAIELRESIDRLSIYFRSRFGRLDR
jgi:hypothetical protein